MRKPADRGRHSEQGQGQGVKHSSNVGRWMRAEMAKETEDEHMSREKP